ncbi:hypothetical protein M885DRAFT_588606 [Pelagophyceae sp. CCMP2097]|nr:hypothetical protein M885DRAFT_588606 [Pelagophyceae sp. CCMP2097]|mmetsp:Transcript_29881/g.103254  ORF Transcript_29881/g.103254 Transcript_29881/m.103254 type:complete len:373 (+) Transcript_29881:214-1332(+)
MWRRVALVLLVLAAPRGANQVAFMMDGTTVPFEASICGETEGALAAAAATIIERAGMRSCPGCGDGDFACVGAAVAGVMCRAAPCAGSPRCAGAVHLLHPTKSAGASLRVGIGCDCSEAEAAQFGDDGARIGKCQIDTTQWPFVCHSHHTTAAGLPFGARYAVVVRHPEARALSTLNYCKGWNLGLSAAETADYCLEVYRRSKCTADYLDAPGNPPAFLGATDQLGAADWQRFRDAFAPECDEAGCSSRLGDFHNVSKFAFSGLAELPANVAAVVREKCPDDYVLHAAATALSLAHTRLGRVLKGTPALADGFDEEFQEATAALLRARGDARAFLERRTAAGGAPPKVPPAFHRPKMVWCPTCPPGSPGLIP